MWPRRRNIGRIWSQRFDWRAWIWLTFKDYRYQASDRVVAVTKATVVANSPSRSPKKPTFAAPVPAVYRKRVGDKNFPDKQPHTSRVILFSRGITLHVNPFGCIPLSANIPFPLEW